MKRAWIGATFVALTLALAPTAGADDQSTAIIAARVGQMRNGARVQVAGRLLASSIVLPDFYERREFRPAWSDARDLEALLGAVRDSANDGLTPSDYHLADLERLRASRPGAERDADLDLLATDSIVRLAYHLRFGRVDVASIDSAWNFRPDCELALAGPPAVVLGEAIEQHRIAEALASLRPQQQLYAELRRALVRYREIQAAGGWAPLHDGPAIEPGESDPRVPALRTRLTIEGDLAAPAGETTTTLDPALADAVRRFQARHGLAVDGVVGGRTLRAINVPVTARIAQIRLSLERGRLILHDAPSRLVVVNVPAFRVHYIDEGGTRFSANVIVGKPFTSTPVFRAEINQVVVNPSWTIPPGIMARDVIPGMARDPDYLSKKGFRKVGDQIVQPPGPTNALGRIKINFPNPHLVYLHDTPQRELFGEEARAFSSGCIRVQNVVELASLVIGDPSRWSPDALRAAIDTGRTQYIAVEPRVPVLLVYWTAVAGVGDGRVYFYEDIYKRDPAELSALDGPFRFRRDTRPGSSRPGKT